MSEGVIKSGHREPFTVLYKSAIRDTRLSFEMLGFLTYMLDKPPDCASRLTTTAANLRRTCMSCRKNHRCPETSTTVNP